MARTQVVRGRQRRSLPRRVPPVTVSRALGAKSPLIDVDLSAFVARCMVAEHWDTYTNEEKHRILESVPKHKAKNNTYVSVCGVNGARADVEEPSASIPLDAIHTSSDQSANTSILSLSATIVTSDDCIKHATARFKRDLQDGYYEKAWQEKARRAHRERLEGHMDEHVQQAAENMFEEENDTNGGGSEDELAVDSEDSEYLNKARKGTNAGALEKTGTKRRTPDPVIS